MSINNACIRKIVSCRDSRIEVVAEELGMSHSEAKDIYTIWTNHLTGRVTKQGLKLLNELRPCDIVLRRKCSSCNQTIKVRARFILKIVGKKKPFKVPTECEQCKKRARYLARMKKKAKSKEEKAKKRLVKSLTHRPFESLMTLNISTAVEQEVDLVPVKRKRIPRAESTRIRMRDPWAQPPFWELDHQNNAKN